MIKNILIIGLGTLFFSCKQTRNKKVIAVSTIDTVQARLDKNENEKLEKRRQIEDEEREDSIRLSKELNRAIEIGYQNINLPKFSKQFETMPDSLFNVTTNLAIDNFFSADYKHLIIHRQSPGYILIDIYLVENNELKKVLTHKEWGITYVSDTLNDVNGDGYKDFILNWYGSSGCCLKAFSNVYLFQVKKGTFTSDYEFINPIFSPKEKIIRGVCYGHPGETEMYKYRWNGEKSDTIAYIYYEKDKNGTKTGKVIQSNLLPGEEKNAIVKRLNTIPKEFTKIMGYDWFIGNVP